MNVTLRQLRAFVSVARSGSFTRAAESMHLTQSALSGLIKELEEAVGLRLIDRSTRRIHLSDVGRGLFPLVDKILQDLEAVLTEVSNLKALRTGIVRLAAPQLMSCTLLPQVIAEYTALHPDIRIHLADSPVEAVASRVFSGEVDFGIGPERDINSEIESTPLFDWPFMAVAPAGHPLTAASMVRWSELAAYPLISLGDEFAERLAADLHPAARDLSADAKVAFMTTAFSMVAAGLGVTICIPYAASLVKLYKLEMRPLIDPVVTRRFFVLRRQGRSLSPAAQSFRDFLSTQIEELGVLLKCDPGQGSGAAPRRSERPAAPS